jgi:hypothetical protein
MGPVSRRGFDGEFFFAVQDPEVGVLDDDGDEFAGISGPGSAFRRRIAPPPPGRMTSPSS